MFFGRFRSLHFATLSLVLSIAVGFQAAANCHIFSQPKNTNRKTRYHEMAEFGLAALIANDGTMDRHIEGEKANFEEVVRNNLSEGEARELALTLEGLRFTDHVHVAEDLIKFFLSDRAGGLLKAKLYNRYNDNENPSDQTFENVRKTRLYLKQQSVEPSPGRLREVHRRAMAGGVEGILGSQLGRFRDYEAQGDHETHPITRKELNAIRKNKYIDFTVTKEEDGYYYGNIEYVGISSASRECLDTIRDTHPELTIKIGQFQRGQIKLSYTEKRALNRELVTALVDERYRYFNGRLSSIGRLNSAAKVLEMIRVVALHYRDLVSIHPFIDGNGRTLRLEALYDPLDRAGIPKPRLNDPDRDVLASPTDWIREVERGVTSNYFLYADMILRIRMGLPYENSVELVYPAVPRNVGIREKDTKKKIVPGPLQLIQVDPNQFGAYFRTRVMLDPDLRAELAWDPILTKAEIREEFKEFIRKTNFFYTSAKGERELVSLLLIDPDFYASFGESWSRDLVRYRLKMNRWYHNELTWRGMGYGEFPVNDAYVLKMFTRIGDHSIAEGLRDEIPENPYTKKNRAKMRRLALEQFDEFNQAVVGELLWRMLQDQVSETGDYDFSIGYSTSKNWGTGRKYAWQSEVEAEGGKTKWEVNDGTRVLVGSRRAKHEVDMSRFGVVDSRFSYQIVREDGTRIPVNRQKEVWGVGAVDPDAVQVVQLINERGNVTVSYVRNSLDPSEVWKVKGRWDSEMDELPPRSRLISTLKLDEHYY